MNAKTSNDLSQIDMVSPCNQDLRLVMLQAKEGLSESTQCDIYETTLFYEELAQHFELEKNSDQVNEYDKCQRDVDGARIKGVTGYFQDREDTTLPSICVFVNSLEKVEQHTIANKLVVEATLSRSAFRFICDGQGRTGTIKSLLQNPKYEALKSHTIAAKVIVTNTTTLSEASARLRQVFSDYNGKTKTPSTSISLYFDSSKPFSNLLREIVTNTYLPSINRPLSAIIAANGTVKPGQLWTYKQFSSYITQYLNATESEMNKVIATSDIMVKTKAQLEIFILNTIDRLPIAELINSSSQVSYHAKALYTKALFANGLAHVARSLVEQALANMDDSVSTPVIDWSKLDQLTSLPITNMADKLWLTYGVCYKEETGKQTVKIMKGCDKIIARVLCNSLSIMPNRDLIR